MYKNSNEFNEKWYYAFITRMEYKNDETTFIYFETDVMQTYLGEFEIKPSFVEREHCADDTVGLHTLPENLETGEYVCNKMVKFDDFNEYGIILATTLTLEATEDYITKNNKLSAAGGGKYNNIYSGLRYYFFENKTLPNNIPSDIEETEKYMPTIYDLNRIIEYIATFSQSDGIISMFMIPKKLIENNNEIKIIQYYSGDLPFYICSIEPSENAYVLLWDKIEKPTSINGYENIRNKKLLTSPYCYLYVDSNGGGANKYEYEYFNSCLNSSDLSITDFSTESNFDKFSLFISLILDSI